MANTGYKGFTSLEEYYTDNGEATGTYKANSPGDPNYVAPVLDTASCPLPGIPVEIALYLHFMSVNINASRLDYEFVVKNGTETNYAIEVRVRNVTKSSGWISVVGTTIYNNTDNNMLSGLSSSLGVTNEIGDEFEIAMSTDGGTNWTGTIYADFSLSLNYDWTL